MYIFLSILLLLVSSAVFTAKGRAQTSAPFIGVQLREIHANQTNDTQAIIIAEIDLTAPGIGFLVSPGDATGGREYRAETTSEFLARHRLALAVNASYFLPFKGGTPSGDDYYPKRGDPVDASGMVMHGGRLISPVETEIDERVNAALCINGARVTIMSGQNCPTGTQEAIAAGPLLLSKGVPQSWDTFGRDYGNARHPRTAIGIDQAGERLWLVVVDGRQPGYSEGATLGELTKLFQILGAQDAINLDGGGSSTLAIATSEGPHVVNRPIHTAVPGRERPVANHIGVIARKNSDSAGR